MTLGNMRELGVRAGPDPLSMPSPIACRGVTHSKNFARGAGSFNLALRTRLCSLPALLRRADIMKVQGRSDEREMRKRLRKMPAWVR
jgi:hypothetical protein